LTVENLSSQLNLWIQRLRAIAQTGLAFEPRVYDRERYEELLKLAADMAATNATLNTDSRLSHELYDHWRAQVQPGVKGYVTPKVGVGAMVFNDSDEILLIKRPTGQWLYPTGWADVGYSPAQVAAKEVLEETGLRATPLRLVAVYDVRALADHPDVSLHFYSLIFYCRLDGGILNRHLTETLDAGFFSREHLPQPLARQDLQWVELAWAAHRGEQREAYFDQP
jgi:ADP-ribose pyrophosphatase YjhB (NUDIX family)